MTMNKPNLISDMVQALSWKKTGKASLLMFVESEKKSQWTV